MVGFKFKPYASVPLDWKPTDDDIPNDHRTF